MTELLFFNLPRILDEEDKSSPLKNRIRNNYRHIRKWAQRTETDCFRIYDRDIPEYHFAIDFYSGRFLVHYFPRSKEMQEVPNEFCEMVTGVLNDLFAADSDLIYWRSRIKREKTQQYEKNDDSKKFFNVVEYGTKFKVNICDYLDTGLFLDHRETRRHIASLSKGKKLLNLFAYTCSFSVHAAKAGASYTKSVDLSNTYTAWGVDNFRLNGLSLESNPVIRADCMRFLDEEREVGTNKYDIIIIDPPTISRSKKMDGMFDIQLDHPDLILKALDLLDKNGVLFFSTNSRKFSFDSSFFSSHSVMDVSSKTIPFDFHDQKIHRCWKITKK